MLVEEAFAVRRRQHLNGRILQGACDGRLELAAARFQLDHEPGQLGAIPPRGHLLERNHDRDGREAGQRDGVQHAACPASVPDAVVQC